METRIVHRESFIVKGYEMKGPVSDIPKLWNRLNEELQKVPTVYRAEESFGITLGIEGEIFHYLAGIKDEFSVAVSDMKEIVIPGGNFIVSEVIEGIGSISDTFSEIMKQPGIQLRRSYCFERYIHPLGAEGYTTEVWVAIEE
ncbi:GyrI-like domain-containing protein [Sporosarcina obsidiansis]|uniref:GyrI-like domain-containing protein n=1 Tax=Sporosarcina obsidiansis TaxID=2660748 RepID=UPI00189134B4|nr:GyrI-like domain-containing protein [Sporosarcina obsidiansis]